MSKTIQDKFRAALGALLQKNGRGAQARLSKMAKIDPGYLSSIIHGRTPGPDEVKERIANHFGLSYQDMLAFGQWLIDGKDPEVFLEQSGKVFFRDSRMIEPDTKADNDQISMSEMIIMTTQVLESRTIYRQALASNIRAFHQAVCKEGELDSVKADMEKMKGEISELRELVAGLKKQDGDCDKDEARRKAAG